MLRYFLLFAISALFFAAVNGFAAEHGSGESNVLRLQPIEIGQPQRIEVVPSAVRLESPSRKVQLVVTGYYADGRVQDLTRAAQFRVASGSIAKVEAAVLFPRANGKTELVVSAGGKEQKISVEVVGQDAEEKVSFLYGTLAALSKQHCNSGGCHGAPSGKGGFSLSMVAFDPESDKMTLTRDFLNRRINPLEPEASLLLRKPLMEIGHRGGLRLRRDDEAYRQLVDWIRQGSQFDPPGTPDCVRIEVGPAVHRVLRWPAHTQQLRVTAKFSDGGERDITRLAMYSSSEETLATVSPEGMVVGNDRGQVAIAVRYLNHVESVYFTFVRDIAGFQWTSPRETNFIDQAVNAKLRQLQFLPSETCSDEDFVRRVFLDVVGLLPTVPETTAFLSDKDPDKRRKLIDSLLKRPEFAKFWAMKWGDLLRIQPSTVGEDVVHKYHRWLVNAWESNVSYDQFARQLLTGVGSTLENPTANYYRVTDNSSDTTEMTAQVFLGARLGCAKCHNHPFDRWTQDNYYGMGAFFDRVKRKPTTKKDERIIYTARRGEIKQPRTGKEMKPWVPETGELDLPADTDRLAAFADWLTKPENPIFARMEVNRIWAQLLGRGIIDPVDDMRDSNPPSNPELLDALAKDFVDHKFDRKHLIRSILNSRTYQASSRPNKFNETDTKFFSHARQQLLTAEQLLDAVCLVTESPEPFGNLPMGTMATQLPAPPKSAASEFLVAFGQPVRQSSCACERQSSPGLTQTLQLFNGTIISNKVTAAAKRIRALIDNKKTDDEIVTELYIAALCRPPQANELQAAREYIASHGDRLASLQDVTWSILNTREFLYRR